MHYNYSLISKHFSDLTDKHCEFIQDRVTMFLKVDQDVFKLSLERDSQGKETLSVEEKISKFEAII